MSPSLVLIVEDDFLVRQSAVFLLKEAGFDTLEAGSADEAVPLLEARSDIKVVFTDINIPGSMDGLELLQRLREKSALPVIFLTSKDEELDEALGLAMGADDYIAKPFAKVAMLLLNTAVPLLLAVGAIFAVLLVNFGV